MTLAFAYGALSAFFFGVFAVYMTRALRGMPVAWKIALVILVW